ncbi:MAG TPA: YheC/YheD family protein [Limnochordales bacterium]
MAALSPSLWSALALPPASGLRLRAGGRIAWVRLSPMDAYGSEGVLALSVDVMRALCLRDGMRLSVRREPLPDRETIGLALGPFVGILARVPGPLLRPYMAAAAEQGIPAFVFRAADVRWRDGVVLGWVPAAGRWRRVRCPLPDVVYDRTIGRWREERRGALLARLSRLGAAVFNGPVGYKWHIHRLLAAHEPLQAHLPVTRRLRAASDVQKLLGRFDGVFLKPEHGFGGDGIVRVQAAGNGRFRMATVTRPGGRWTDAWGLLRRLSRLARGRPYLVQQELDLARWRGRRFDVRVLVLRDDQGRWQVAGTAVRVGAAGSIVSNLRRGGRAYNPLRVLAEAIDAGPAAVEGCLAAVERVALAAATAVGEALPAVGELGVDVGVDRHGHPWLIEVNPKPGRKSFAREDGAVRRRVFGLPFQYARFLAGFSGSDGSAPELVTGR